MISVKITFFDLVEPENDNQKAMYDDINIRDYALKAKLDRLINL